MSTSNLTFFNFFSPVEPAGQLQESEQLFKVLPGRLLLDLGAWVFSCVTEQLCPESRAAGARASWASPAVGYRPNNCTQSRQLPGLLGPDSPNNYSFSGQDGGWAASRTEQLFGLAAEPGWAGTRKRTMAGFCGFGSSPKPDPEALGKPEPESPRHPRK